MKWKRRALRAMLGVVILFDVLMFMRFHRHGWPAQLSIHDLGEGRAQVSVTRVPISTADWLIGAFLVSIQGVVVYANLRIKRGPAQAPAKIMQ